MSMAIDESWQNKLLLSINHFLRQVLFLYLLCGADRNNRVASNGYCALGNDCSLAVHGDYRAIIDNNIRMSVALVKPIGADCRAESGCKKIIDTFFR